MALTLPEEPAGTFELCPAGNHLAICHQVIDIGTQNSDYGPKRKLYIYWELCEEQMEDGRPFTTRNIYTLSAHEKSNFRKHLESWRNKAFTKEEFGNFTLNKLIGVPCMLQIVHTPDGDKVWANVAAVSSVPKGLTPPKLVNPTVFFSLDPEEFSETIFNELPEKLQDTIASSPEFAKVAGKGAGAPAAGEDDADGVPF